MLQALHGNNSNNNTNCCSRIYDSRMPATSTATHTSATHTYIHTQSCTRHTPLTPLSTSAPARRNERHKGHKMLTQPATQECNCNNKSNSNNKEKNNNSGA